MCEECNIVFIGPKKAKRSDDMGNKINARQLMQQADVPVIPGSDGVLSTVEEALEVAEKNWLSSDAQSRCWWWR